MASREKAERGLRSGKRGKAGCVGSGRLSVRVPSAGSGPAPPENHDQAALAQPEHGDGLFGQAGG